jgi:hypothetical protein
VFDVDDRTGLGTLLRLAAFGPMGPDYRGGFMRHARVLTVLAAVVFALAGCGTEDGGGETASAEAFDGQSAQQILEQATAAAKAAKSVHVKGDITEDGDTFTLDMKIGETGAGGSISLAGEKVELRQVGTAMYIKGGPVSALDPDLADTWVKVEEGDPGAADFSDLMSMEKIFDEMLEPEGSITKVAGKDVAGTPTVGLQDAEGSDGETDDKGILYIAAEGTAYPLLIESTAGSGGLTFTEWNEPVEVKAPPKGKTVTSKDLAKSAGNG